MDGRVIVGLLALGCWLLFGGRAPILGRQFTLPAHAGLLSVSSAAGPAFVTPPPALPPRTQIFVGQGFDTCEVPSLAALQAWFTQSPYRAVNLYIGGSGRYCGNKKLNAELVAQLDRIGWKFIPTWVGPQAPCYAGRKPPMSSDPAVAYAEGVAEAAAASKVAADLGLALPDGSGTIIYYDMEAYASQNPACNEPVRAFISGWTGELRARGNLAGVYGNPHALTGFASIANVPDAVWPARWLYTTYNPNVTVWDVPGLSRDLWAQHQRIWQYAGDHNETWNAAASGHWSGAADQDDARSRHSETWGGITLNIDCNVIDGIVATISGPPPSSRVYLPLVMDAGPAP